MFLKLPHETFMSLQPFVQFLITGSMRGGLR